MVDLSLPSEFARASGGIRMAMSSQQFCLRWNNHQSNMMTVFEHLLQSEMFTDVSIAVEGRTLKAHKMVLSACSPYFQSVLSSHPDKHPIVILKDIRYSEMKDLLDFMYRGEVSVDQENLSTFLRVAQSLRIKGLTEVGDKRPGATESYLIPGGGGPGSPHSSSHSVPNGSVAISAPPTSLLPTTPLPGDPPPLKRPTLSPSAQQAKRRRGRPPKISGEEESESDLPVSHDEESRCGSSMVETDIKVEAEEGGELKEDSRPPSLQNADSRAGPSTIELMAKNLSKNSDDGETLRRSPGSELCCVPDIWMTEGKMVRLGNSSLSISAHNGHLSNGETPLNLKEETTITPTTNMKVERPTPSVTPTSGLSLSPTSPLLNHSNFSAMMEPVQNMPLDLHIGDTCDSSDTDPNATLDYVLNGNGSATCRLCGELLPSRNHWYRHKYKTHASAHYRCDECGVVYKSKRGYETHMEMKHDRVRNIPSERPRRRDWEGVNKVMEEAKRKQEEAMVKAIIARVKIECAMEGEDCSRRGYQKH